MNTDIVRKSFVKWKNETIIHIEILKGGASKRINYKIVTDNNKYIATYNENKKEAEFFIYLTEIFKKKGFNVPEIYYYDKINNIYFQEYLGDNVLHNHLNKIKNETYHYNIYKKIIQDLIKFQIECKDIIDYSKSCERSVFDDVNIKWDLNYFKYCFIKLAYIDCDEEKLENEFNNLTNYLLSSNNGFFMYRDFQTRNIIEKNGKYYYIDYQGCRKGPLQYDLASLLYSSRCNIDYEKRDKLVDYYLSLLKKLYSIIKVENKEFKQLFYGYSLLRSLQILGAYGYRGLYEQKSNFIKLIKTIANNVIYVTNKIPINLPEIKSIAEKIINSSYIDEQIKLKMLTVSIYSFSYKRGYPYDITGNGGGFVFDCRFLNNPGRYEEYSNINGNNKEVENFFNGDKQIEEFINNTTKIVINAIETYKKREFTNLYVAYGCTGGQHRSVYCANQLFKQLSTIDDIVVKITHTELNKN